MVIFIINFYFDTHIDVYIRIKINIINLHYKPKN